MSGPIILSSLSFTVMLFVGEVMVARLGTDALAATGSAGLWSYIVVCFFLGIVGCVSTFASQSFGRGEFTDCARYAWQGLYLSAFAGAIGFLFLPFIGPLFRSMGHAPSVTNFEITYLRIRVFGFGAMAWLTALSAFFQGIGRPRVPMYTSILANMMNVVLNYVLIFGHFGFPRMGVAGSATATVLSLLFQAVSLQVLFMARSVHEKYGTRHAYAFDWTKIREILRIGVPCGFTFFMDVANWGIFTSFIVGHFGTVALASHNAAINFMHLSFMPAIGLNQGIAAIVGQYLGRKDPDTAASRTYTALKIAIVYMFLMGIVFAFFGKPLIGWFFSSDPEVLRVGHALLLLAALFQGFDAINIVTSGALRGAGDTRWMAIATFLLAYLFFLPLALVMAFAVKLGAIGAWVGATAYIIVLSGILFSRFRSGHWRRITIFVSEMVSKSPS